MDSVALIGFQSQSAKSSASTSTTPKTLPLATATVAGGNAGSDPAVTAPQPGSGKGTPLYDLVLTVSHGTE